MKNIIFVGYRNNAKGNLFYLLILLFLLFGNLFAQQINNLQIIWQKTSPRNVLNFGRSISSGDLNGDGFSDIVIVGDSLYGGDTYTVKAYIYYGGLLFDTIPDLIIARPESTGFMDATVVKDINNDGYDDLVLGSQHINEISIFFGGNPMDTICDYRIRGPHSGSLFGQAISSGDVNGDGYSDLIVGAYGAAPMPGGYLMGQVFIYFGGPNFDTIPDVILNGGHHNDQEGFGSDIGYCADVNSDGYDDVIIGACNFGLNHGRLYVYFGGNPMDTIADVTMMGEGVNHFLGRFAMSSIRNLINYDYAIIGTPLWPYGFPNIGNGKIYILFGGIPMDSVPDVYMTGRTSISGLSQSLSRAGYISSFFSDAIISGVPRESNYIGYAYIWLGEPNLDTIPDAWLRGLQYDDGVGWAVATAGDVDGDGRDEVMISNYASNFTPKRVWVCKYTGVGIEENRQPFSAIRLLLEVYPNPVKAVLRVSCPWSVKEIKVYDIAGKIIKTLKVDSRPNTEHREIMWNLKDENQKRVANGIYFVELIAEQEKERIREIRKITIIK